MPSDKPRMGHIVNHTVLSAGRDSCHCIRKQSVQLFLQQQLPESEKSERPRSLLVTRLYDCMDGHSTYPVSIIAADGQLLIFRDFQFLPYTYHRPLYSVRTAYGSGRSAVTLRNTSKSLARLDSVSLIGRRAALLRF